MNWLRRLVLTAIIFGASSVGSAAVAHSVFYNIQAYYQYETTGQYVHYNRQHSFQPYDYALILEAQVYQHAPSNYQWTYLNHVNGWLLNAQYAYMGRTWIYGCNGGCTVYESSLFLCEPVQQPGIIYLGYPANGGRQGYWYQQSGAGGSNCLLNYTTADNIAVTGLQ